jgi:hypothetical protein
MLDAPAGEARPLRVRHLLAAASRCDAARAFALPCGVRFGVTLPRGGPDVCTQLATSSRLGAVVGAERRPRLVNQKRELLAVSRYANHIPLRRGKGRLGGINPPGHRPVWVDRTPLLATPRPESSCVEYELCYARPA